MFSQLKYIFIQLADLNLTLLFANQNTNEYRINTTIVRFLDKSADMQHLCQ